ITTPAGTDLVSFVFSPDNHRIVFLAYKNKTPQLWLRTFDVNSSQPLNKTEGAIYPFWSPDSKSVSFFAGDKLKRIDIGGGLPQTLADAPTDRSKAWSP